ADLGSNESVEHFPVGRSLAFDAERGRLWAVCPRCARWNLAPIEERWEAIEDAERLFRDTRLHVHSANVGMARRPEGTRLIRVGQALPGELASWRYGEHLARRTRRYVMAGTVTAAVTAASFLGVAGLAGVGAAWLGHRFVRPFVRGYRDAEVLYTHRPPGAAPDARQHVRRSHLRWARLQPGEDGGVDVYLPLVQVEVPVAGPGVLRAIAAHPLVIPGDTARMMLGRGMVSVNTRGARPRELEWALRVLDQAGSAEGYLRAAARRQQWLYGGTALDRNPADPNPIASLALEIALHEETERRAMEGELAALEEMWRQAEAIASIADRLPDDVPASAPPRIA
ncbi:hypothetical protein, partial [Longimicrobium sp.]|uniref:hypothetical protein n=1 Tax=Longimicrobium sp. TaxID=2029185 RepID=UPI002E341D8A